MAKVKLGKFEVEEEVLDRQYEEATKRGEETLRDLLKADSARFDKNSRRLVLEMQNGTTVLVPVHLIQGLQTADDKDLVDLRLVAEGTQIHWDKLDVQFYVKSLIEGIFGTKKWMKNLNEHLAEIGRRGGKSTSKAKSEASRHNGLKGGRPKKKVA
jgi:hypothetical protein